MQEAGLPETQEEAYARVRASPSSSEGFAFLGIPVHCKKRLAIFPSPAGMSLTKLSLATGNNLTSRESFVSDIPAGTGKSNNLFFTVYSLLNYNLSFFTAAHV
jgi:hypothetical protein